MTIKELKRYLDKAIINKESLIKEMNKNKGIFDAYYGKCTLLTRIQLEEAYLKELKDIRKVIDL